MKAASSKSESRKRKRDGSQESITESTKKAKVHAQRKFAQGAAFNSPVITPIKDKVRPPAAVSSSGPILSGKCPNTEDFLTFLCFRRTSILPAKLDFFKDAFGSESESPASTERAESSVNHKSNSEHTAKQSSRKSEKNEDGKKSQAPAVQALRRKYQEQRLAKQKPTNVTTLAKKVKGKNMVRTRSSAVAEETKTPVKKHEEKEPKSIASGLRSGLKRIQPSPTKISKKTAKPKQLRSGLRSGGSVSPVKTPAKSNEDTKSTPETKPTAGKKSEKETKKSKTEVPEAKVKPAKTRRGEGFSDFSSDDNEPLLAVKKMKMGGKAAGKGNAGRPQGKTVVKKIAHGDDRNSSKILLRPTRKTKEAAALYMEMITKKLVSPEKSGDDDVSSVDSFPELPNVKRTEQRETEIKAKALAPKKSEEKTKESRKSSAKKTEVKTSKESPAKIESPKKNPKTIIKSSEKEKMEVKRSSRTSVKGVKCATKEEDKKEQIRPSTRSRPQESVPSPKKSPGKVVPKNKIKANLEKESEKPAEVGRKSKVNKEEKPKPKRKSEQREVTEPVKKSAQKDQESFPKASTSGGRDGKDAKNEEGKQEPTKNSRKTGDKKLSEKNEVEEKEETPVRKGRKSAKPTEAESETKKAKPAESGSETKKAKPAEAGSETKKAKPAEAGSETKKAKPAETGSETKKAKPAEAESETKKVKPAEKKTEKKPKKEVEEKHEAVVVSKRPTRKCSTADKIWIDIDGFTSDEDDFLEVTPLTKTRASAKKVVSKSGRPNQKAEPEKKATKPETPVTQKTKNEKTKESVPKAEDKKPEIKKGKVDNKAAEEVPLKTTQHSGEKSETKVTNGEEKGTEKREGVPKAEKKVKVESNQDSDTKRNTGKPSEQDVKKGGKEVASSSALSVGKKKDGEKNARKEERREASKSTGIKSQRIVSRQKPKKLSTGKEEEEDKEEQGSKKRTRPVRQCSTGEKRWIETDSDFSFYETSDDEDNLPIVDFSKIKSSLDKLPLEDKPSVEKVAERKTAPEKEDEENFSESDEEPLKKKSHIEDTSKKPEPEINTPGKNQREVPGLTPLKKSPVETLLPVNIPLVQKPGKLETTHLPIIIPTEPKPLCYEPKTLDLRPQPLPQPIIKPVEIPSFLPEPSLVSVPNRIEMILHSLKRDKMAESAPRSNDVKVTFGSVPYQPIAHSSQMNQIPCTYQVKATFPSGREPISTHGLDLLSEVALPTTPKENSQTKRIEKWLNDSLAADQKDRFSSFDSMEYKTGGDRVPEKPQSQPEVAYYFGKPPNSTPPKVGVSSHSEFQKFGQVELFESQKLLKKNLFAAEVKQDATKAEQQQSATPKKTLTSVQDLLKLQKERKEVAKAADNAPHLKNCKCNNCIVKKGWFKNKPVPKAGQQKSSSVEEHEESSKPFESLTKAFIGEAKNSKMSVSVAPMVMSTPSSSKDDAEKKGAFQQRKLSFLERMKERERKEVAAAAKPSPNAFSPSNESSVYAFEPEPEHSTGTNTPFRSRNRESRTSSTSRSDDEGLRICEEESPTMSSGTQVEKALSDKSVKASQSASIAVQVNLDSETVAEVEPPPELQDGKSIEISTQTEVAEEDSDSPMFYIPLQQATATGASVSSEQQLIRGVALKLGTEGPMGPNQRVIMKAKLVTKPPENGSIKAVVMPQPKRMFDQKYSNPPIGTVQPTTRKPPEEPVANKSGNAKPVIPSAKDNSEPGSEDSEVSKTTKTTPTGKPGKNKEKTQMLHKEKPETTDENLPCTSAASSSKSKRPGKQKSTESVINPTNSTWLPPAGTASKLVEAPTFHPTEKDFQDPFEFFDRIRPAAEKFGLCRIVPPSNFKPDCKVSDDMRFTAYNQYVHRMFHRWGPNIKEMMAIKKYLATQSISLKQPPWIGGIEVDLPRLYQSVQNCGGLMKVMEKKKWHQVADMMKIPKAAQDRVTKLDDIYCKYLLPYDTLSHDERQKLFDEVEKDWAERQKTPVESQDSQEGEETEENYIEECEECVVKGRNMALNQFYRIARNTMSMWFRNPEPSPREVETEFWKHVSERNHHVCVHSGSIDSSGWGYGFPIAKNNSFSKHPWNLKVLTNNSGSVLRYLGPVMGVTVPTLHVGMVFTAFCWYRDPHGLPWIEYLHTGAPKIWHGISDDNSTVFQEALTKLLPRYIKNKTIWLPSDTAMIPPELLVEHGVSLCHTVQEPGQFILVFPRAFTSSICTGYLVSESVYFAQLSWLTTAEQVFKDIQESCEPSMFSLEKLLFSIATDSRTSVDVLKQVLPMVWHVRQKEIDGRKTLSNLGLKSSERLPAREPGSKKKKGRWAQEDDGDYECEICRTNLYVSLVTNSQEEGVYCLPHAIDLLTQKRHQLKYCKLMYTYTQEEMNEMVEKLEQRIENKSQKKPQSKPSTSAK